MVLEKLLMRLNVDQIKRQEILRAAEDKAKELLHIQGEGVCVAEDISGRYKIDPPT